MHLDSMDTMGNYMLGSKLLGRYRNGNYFVSVYSDGTKVRATGDNCFCPSFPESIDLKITNQCDKQCAMCHEGSMPYGDHADLNNVSFLDDLPPFSELAIGGGNPLSHPQLKDFLLHAKSKRWIPNITVHQDHFMQSIDTMRKLRDDELVYGIGVSVCRVDDALIQLLKEFPNSVVHVINGIVDKKQIDLLSYHGLKVLILGYKNFRRGIDLYNRAKDDIMSKQNELFHILPTLTSRFDVVSFDNLALEQLQVKRLMSDQEWDRFYMGDDGQFTMYIDLVSRSYAKNSTSKHRYELHSDIKEIFAEVRRLGRYEY